MQQCYDSSAQSYHSKLAPGLKWAQVKSRRSCRCRSSLSAVERYSTYPHQNQKRIQTECITIRCYNDKKQLRLLGLTLGPNTQLCLELYLIHEIHLLQALIAQSLQLLLSCSCQVECYCSWRLCEWLLGSSPYGDTLYLIISIAHSNSRIVWHLMHK